jgi:hypothetical protein
VAPYMGFDLALRGCQAYHLVHGSFLAESDVD